ncbi:MAG: UDP-glucose 4-epimerase GalE [Coriobacteriales bacterium]|nr:UDP-glucose 4-epimerase GalE [Coriobacteriales bacterium]
MKILVTGGCGYIGSHTVVELIDAGHKVCILDNLSNSSSLVLDRIEKITGTKPEFFKGDIKSKDDLNDVFNLANFDCVIHFAGLKAVGESVEKPLEYYENNVCGTINLLQAMREHNCNNIIFSSSATVYGSPKSNPIFEDFPKLKATNPYGETKSVIEDILIDNAKANANFNAVLLRYFNPIGAHKSGLIGEDPKGIPNNLMPYITQVAVGKLERLGVFGNDYNTVDGTGVRDYIHVVDLSLGHLASLKCFDLDNNPQIEKSNCHIYNLGTGKGTSVLELVDAFESANDIEIPYEICPRRAGDIDECFANCDKAFKELGWKTKFNIVDMANDSWNWQINNPQGYQL